MGRRMPFALLAVLLCAASGVAAAPARVDYDGELIPGNYEAPVRLKLQMSDEAGSLTGEGQAMAPSAVAVRFSGTRFGGMCSGTLRFANETMAHLEGECSSERFDGKFKLFPRGGKKVTGLFQLVGSVPKAEPGAGKKESSGAEDEARMAPKKSATVCLRLKVACLTACPQGDYNAEFLCANGCRRKEAACLGKGRGLRAFGGSGSPAGSPYAPAFPEDAMPQPEGTEPKAEPDIGSPRDAPYPTSPSK